MGSNEMIFKWKNHSNQMRDSLKSMRLNGDFVDVTLWCEKRSIRAHKCLLAAGSPYFEEVLKQDVSPNPIIVFKNMKYDDLMAVVSYIYDGTVKVEQGRWRSFVETAEMFLVSLEGAESLDVNDTDAEGNDLVDPTLDIESLSEIQNPKGTANSTDDNTSFDTKVIRILREVRLGTVDVNVANLLKLDIFTPERSSIVIGLIIGRVIHFTKFATIYVKFCKSIIDKENNYVDNDKFSFKKLLLNKCHDLFTNDIFSDQSSNERYSKRWERCLGIVRFVGVLYMHKLLYANIIDWVIGRLLEYGTEDKLEYLSELLGIVGMRIEMKMDNQEVDMQWYRDLSSHYETLEDITTDMDHQISFDTRKLLSDLVKNRNNGWQRPPTLLLGEYGPPAYKKGAQKQERPRNGNRQQNKEIAANNNIDEPVAVQSIIDSLRSFIQTQSRDAPTERPRMKNPLNRGLKKRSSKCNSDPSNIDKA